MSAHSSNYSIFEKLLILYARRFPIRRGKLRLINSLWRAAVLGRGTDRLAVLKYSGFKMTCDLNQMLQRQFYFFGTYFLEEDHLHHWRGEARGVKIVFDVGANTGIYSLAALSAQRDANVHAFEPTPEIAAHLRETAALNGLDHLFIHEAAVLGKKGQAVLRRFRGETGTNEGMNFISTEFNGPGAEHVQAICLDQFCLDHGINRIDLLKIDVQGHEHSVLRGAENLLRDGRITTIFMELNWAKDSRSVCPASESIDILEKTGYKFCAVEDHVNFKQSGAWMSSMTNVIARRK